MKLVVSQNFARGLTFTNYLRIVGTITTIFLVITHFIVPSMAWMWSVLTAYMGIVGALSHLILVSRAKKSLFEALKKIS